MSKNYNLENIILRKFVQVQEGQLDKLSIDGKINSETENDYFKLIDDVNNIFDEKNIETEKEKRLLIDYVNLLKKVIEGGQKDRRAVTELNMMYSDVQALFNKNHEPKTKWDDVIANVSTRLKFYIDTSKMKAKEFLFLLKNLTKNGK